jgi:3-hydroxybutyryl-CoA dehydrogenase
MRLGPRRGFVHAGMRVCLRRSPHQLAPAGEYPTSRLPRRHRNRPSRTLRAQMTANRSIEEATTPTLNENLGIVGSGVIACGLAATAARAGKVMLWARSGSSADRARAQVDKLCAKEVADAAVNIEIVRDLDALGEASFLVEAVVEHHGSKAAMLEDLAQRTRPDAVLATTTSSLSIEQLARAAGSPERFLGLHVFNPVPRMKLVELVFPDEATEGTRARARGLCEALGKTAVEVPDVPGFVVNRLLFPYLFSAVELMDETGMAPEDVDRCMTLGASMPMGPIALLDFVGLDVAEAIGDAIGAPVPAMLRSLVQNEDLGRKSGRGFYTYG